MNLADANTKQKNNKLLQHMIEFANHGVFKSLRSGLVFAIPFFIAGSMALIINHMPIADYQHTMLSLFGANWKLFGAFVNEATFGLVSLCVSCSIGASIATKFNDSSPATPVSKTMTSLVSLSSFALLMATPGQSVANSSWSGINGFALAIVISHISSHIFIFLSQAKSLKLKLHIEDADVETSQVFECIFAAIISILIIAFCKIIFVNSGISNFSSLMQSFFVNNFSPRESPWGATLFFSIGNQVAWFFGLHGPTLFDYILNGEFLQMAEANVLASDQGIKLPYIINKSFFDTFIFIGGSGGTLSLILAIFAVGENSSSKRIAKYGIIPSLFNINELILFGLPIVLNPIYLIPFVFTPIILCFNAWFFIYLDIVPGISAQADWTTPPLINAYIATGSIKGTLLQLGNIIIGTLIYIPFVKISDAARIVAFENSIAQMINNEDQAPQPIITSCTPKTIQPVLTASEETFVRALGNDLEQALVNINLNGPLQLNYLPRLDQRFNRINALESSLVWQHPLYGQIPDKILQAVTNFTENKKTLAIYILNLAIEQRRAWFNQGLTNLVVNVNLDNHLFEDKIFISKLSSILEKQQDLPGLLELSIHASSVLMLQSNLRNLLRELQLTGVRLCIEGYNAGQGSLLYLRRLNNISLKLDANICKELHTSKINQEICIEIMRNCRNFDITTIADGVENNEQVKFLLMQGCKILQGPFIGGYKSGTECFDFVSTYRPERPL